MTDANINLGELSINECCELLKNETVYFKFNNNNHYYEHLIDTPNTEMLKLQDIINIFINEGQIKEYEELKEENKRLKSRIKELTKLEKYKIFDSLEPKKKIKVTEEELQKIKELKAEKIPVRIIASTYGVTEQTIYNYLKR